MNCDIKTLMQERLNTIEDLTNTKNLRFWKLTLVCEMDETGDLYQYKLYNINYSGRGLVSFSKPSNSEEECFKYLLKDMKKDKII